MSGFSAFGVLTTLSLPPSATSHAQPLPNCPIAAAENCLTNSSWLPNDAPTRSATSFGIFASLFGRMLFQ